MEERLAVKEDTDVSLPGKRRLEEWAYALPDDPSERIGTPRLWAQNEERLAGAGGEAQDFALANPVLVLLPGEHLVGFRFSGTPLCFSRWLSCRSRSTGSGQSGFSSAVGSMRNL